MSQITLPKRRLHETSEAQESNLETQDPKRVRVDVNSENLFVLVFAQKTIAKRMASHLTYTDLRETQSTCTALNVILPKRIDFTKFKDISDKKTDRTIVRNFIYIKPYVRYIALRINYGQKRLPPEINEEHFSAFRSNVSHHVIPKLYSVASLKLKDNAHQTHLVLHSMATMKDDEFFRHFRNLRQLKLPSLEKYIEFLTHFANGRLFKFPEPPQNLSQAIEERGTHHYRLTLERFFRIPLKQKELKLTGNKAIDILLQDPNLFPLVNKLSALTIKAPTSLTKRLDFFIRYTVGIRRIGFSKADQSFMEALDNLSPEMKEILYPKINKLTLHRNININGLKPGLGCYIDILNKTLYPLRFKDTTSMPLFLLEVHYPTETVKKIYRNMRYLTDPNEPIFSIQDALNHADRLVKIRLKGLDEGEPANIIQRSFEKFNYNDIQRILRPVKTLIMGDYEYRMHPLLLTHILLSAKNVEELDLGRPTSHFEHYIDLLENNQYNGKAKGQLLKECFTFPNLVVLRLNLDPQKVQIILNYCPDLEGKIENKFEPGENDPFNTPIIIEPQFIYGPEADLVEPASESEMDEDILEAMDESDSDSD